jgi:hypothetical protein
MRILPVRLVLYSVFGAAALALHGQSSAPMPPDYRGVNIRVGGVFVTPVPNAPFSATVEIVSKTKLQDGSFDIHTTTSHIARDAAGRIYNERRALVSTAVQGDPALLGALIFDPNTRLSTSLDPFSHLARQRVLPPRAERATAILPLLGPHSGGHLAKEEDMGEQTLSGIVLHGTRKSWTVPAALSGTGKELEIVDQYWYSPDLSIYTMIQHDDPRTGEQIVAVKNISRTEPDAALFSIPSGYRIVDETPAP